MNEQTSLNSGFHAEPDFKVYNGWILTVGELKKKLAVYNDHDQVRLDFRGNKGHSFIEIAFILDRSEAGVRGKAARMGYTFKNGVPFKGEKKEEAGCR